MGLFHKIHKPAVAAFAFALTLAPIGVVARPVADILAELQNAEPAAAKRLADEARREWARSGSAAMDLLLKKGRDAAERGDWGEAVEHFTALTDHAPDFAEGWHMRATAFYNLDKYGPALADLERALALNPEHFEAIGGLAVILERLGLLDEAFEAYLRVQALHPHHAKAKDAIDRLEPVVRGRSL